MKEAIGTSNQCPDRCMCTSANRVVDCNNASLNDIPMGLHQDIRHLTICHNNITVLRTNRFVGADLIHLETLTLEFNGIFVVEPGAFNGLPALKDLHLRKNNISTLQLGIFLNMTNLRGLHIAGNNIRTLTSNVFLGLENLGYVSLEGNQVEELHADVFIGLINLRNLWLSDNRLTYLRPDVLKHMPKLELISLKNNENLYVPTDRPFLNAPSLRHYLLSGCNIRSLSAKSFQMSPNLTYLDLKNNSLRTIDIEMLESLPQLENFQLFGNPFECDCSLQDVWKWCRKHKIATGYEDEVPKCHSPDSVSGLWWGVLGQAQCSDGKIEFRGDYKSIVHEYVSYSTEFDQYMDLVLYVESSVYGIMFLFGAIGNITVMIIIGCNKRMRTVPNAYIFNLAVGDLLSLTMNLPLYHFMRLTRLTLLGGITCQLAVFLLELSIGVSGFSVAVLSIQRYCATSGPLYLSTRRATVTTLMAVWFLACFCALPSAFSTYADLSRICSPYYRMEYYKMTLCFHLLVFCIIPLCVIVFLYAATARNLVRRAHFSEEELRWCKTLAKIVTGLAIVFFVSFVPYHVLIIILEWKEPMFQLYLGYMLFISRCLLALNPCLNPVSLCCTSVTFKKLFKHYLLDCYCNRSVQESENSDFPTRQEASVHYRRDFSTETVML